MSKITSLPILQRLGLTGKPSSPPSSAELGAAMSRFERERESAAATLTALTEERGSLLLLGDDDALDALEQRQQAAARSLDRIDAALAELEGRHADAVQAEQAERRTAALARHREAARLAFDKLHGAVQAAVAANEVMIGAVADAQIELGADAAQVAPRGLIFDRRLREEDVFAWAQAAISSFEPPPPRGTPGHLILLQITGQFAGFNVGERAAFSPTEARRIIDAGRASLVDANDERRLPPPPPNYRTEPTPEVRPDGTIRVIFLKSESVGSHGGYIPGETAAFLAATAEGLVRAGVARWAPEQIVKQETADAA